MGALLLFPFFAIRFLLLNRLNPEAVNRAAHFAPMRGIERLAYWIYQLSTGVLLFCLIGSKIKFVPFSYFSAGAALYVTGCILLAAAVYYFAAPDEAGMNQSGPYRVSRNPMYVAYFIFFLGCMLLIQSLLMLLCLICFQLSAHWIILAEERWCIEQFGDSYRRYMQEVRRYL